jgi:hypothetical protein
LQGALLEDAIKTLVGNQEILYPVYHNVLITVHSVFDRLTPATQDTIINHLRNLMTAQSRVMLVDLCLQYAVRVLSKKYMEESRMVLAATYRTDRNGAIKRDIILALARWRDWHWLSDVKNRFRQLTDEERRGFIIASFGLADEGEHWRRHVRREFSPIEQLAKEWSEAKHGLGGWQLPL